MQPNMQQQNLMLPNSINKYIFYNSKGGKSLS